MTAGGEMKDVLEAMALSFLLKYEGDGYGSSPEAMRAALSAALERGYRLVPVEPTEEMIRSADPFRPHFGWSERAKFIGYKEQWRAMIAASPEVK